MSRPSKKLDVLIAYNDAASDKTDYQMDLISEAEVEEEAQDVFEAITELGHTPTLFPLSDILADLNSLKVQQPDVIFNLCEGYCGDARHEMHVAGIWELLGIPYTGNSPLTLGLSQNKAIAKKLLESKKIPTPMYQVYTKTPKNVYLDFPIIVKPVREDASLGITQDSVAEDFEQLKEKTDRLLEIYRQPVLAEKFISGREFNIGILGNTPTKVLPISEIDFSELDDDHHPITSYEAKWIPDHPIYKKTPARCPAMVDNELRSRLQDLALQVFQLLQGRDYGRVDVRVDESEKIYVLEFNPNPDISLDAGFANALRAAGIKYSEFVDHVINQALNR